MGEQCSWQVFTFFVADWYSGIHSKCQRGYTPGYWLIQRATVSLTVFPVDLYTQSVYPRLLTDTSGYNVACKSSYPLSLSDNRVYASSDMPLYPGLLTDIRGNSVADTGLRILCRWQIFRYTIQVPGRYTPRNWLTQGYSVAERSSYTLSLTDIPVYTSSVRGLYPRLLIDTQGNSVAYRS